MDGEDCADWQIGALFQQCNCLRNQMRNSQKLGRNVPLPVSRGTGRAEPLKHRRNAAKNG